jgi:hypothetical protein
LGAKRFFLEKKRVDMHNITGTKCDEGNFIGEGGTKILKTPLLILRKSLHFVLR